MRWFKQPSLSGSILKQVLCLQKKEYDSYSLDDEDVDLTGRDIIKFSFHNVEQPVSSWADMIEYVVKELHQQDRSVLTDIAYSTDSFSELQNVVSNMPDRMRSPLPIDENIYLEKNTSTAYKLVILRRLFALFHEDPMSLVFYLKDENAGKATDEDRNNLRLKYWTYALPTIQEANANNGSFTTANSVSSNTLSGYFGIGGFSINCVANYDEASVKLWLSNGDKEKNKEAFDLLYTHKQK